MCKKQTAVSHSSAEAGVISLDAGLKMEGIPALTLWDQVQEVLLTCTSEYTTKDSNIPSASTRYPQNTQHKTDTIDYAPPSLPITYGSSRTFVFEDNEAVIKMVIKGRSPNLRRVPRTRRVDLDWLF